MKNILELDYKEAKQFFLKENCYFDSIFPQYFNFQNLINKVSELLEGKLLTNFYGTYNDLETGNPIIANPSSFESVNYKFLINRDGKFAWRPIQLIHPAIYVSLVHNMTEEINWNFVVTRFKDFSKNTRIKCLSIPLETQKDNSDKSALINNWWIEVEQKSIELALEYENVVHTDISDCYGSIYSHSISWALHGKETAKLERRNKKLIGNVIDRHIQDMSFGQTNGIPQGSILMDFIAEIVLGYIDLELSNKLQILKVTEYQILRFRDDYRIFTNNSQVAELILKSLTEILIELGMRLNSQKTSVSNNVIENSIKSDKLYWLRNKRAPDNLEKYLLLIHNISKQYPNSGTLLKVLDNFFNKIKDINRTNLNISVLISILFDITINNPKTYPISAAILSKLLSLIETNEEQKKILKLITKRFANVPNTGHLQIWLQRITLKIDDEITYDEILCRKVTDSSVSIWNSEWLKDDFKNLIDNESIIDKEILSNINSVIDSKEVELFEWNVIYE
jgi:hypothetical protein